MRIKRHIVVILLTSLFNLAEGQETLEISVANVNSDKGIIQLALYESEANFMKRPLRTYSVSANGGVVHIVIDQLSPGDYAISCFHDLNSNKKLDTNWIGLPVEPYGFSNDARGTFGPPSFKQTKFSVKKGKNTIEFRVK